MALIKRSEDASEPPVVRVHSGCVTGDIFHSLRCDCYAQLQAAMAHITSVPNGVLLYLPYHEGRGIGLVNKIRAYALQDQGMDTVDANVEIGAPIDAREYDLAAHILFDLGFPRIRLLTNNPAKVDALRAAGIVVVERLPVISSRRSTTSATFRPRKSAWRISSDAEINGAGGRSARSRRPIAGGIQNAPHACRAGPRRRGTGRWRAGRRRPGRR